MSKDLNRWVGIGRLGKDPEIKQLGSDKKVLNVNIAVNGFKDGDVAWVPVIFWDKLAEIVSKYCEKGSKIAVEGHLLSSSWEKEGEKRFSLSVVADSVQFLSKNNKIQTEDEPMPESVEESQ
jgi:single-strand DNA-binding protein